MTGPAHPLRVGLLLDEPVIPWWLVGALRAAIDEGTITVVLAVLRASTPPPTEVPKPVRWWRNRNRLMHELYERVEAHRTFGSPPPPDIALTDLATAIPVLEVTPRTTTFSDRVDATDIERIRAHRPDLLIRIGFRILRGEILSAVPGGVWSFHHGDNRGGPPCTWEVLEDLPVTGITLQRLTEDLDGGEVLDRAVIATRRFSLSKTRSSLYRKSSPLLLHALRRAHRDGIPAAAAVGQSAEGWVSHDHHLHGTPTNRQMLERLLRLGWSYLRERLGSNGKVWHWSLAWEMGPPSDSPSGPFHDYREITPPPDRYWADPFPVHQDGRWWIFFEQYRFADARGTICVLEMSQKGPVGEPTEVLTEPFHLSYPHVFRYGQEWYMLPDSTEAGDLRLYRAQKFPDQWTFERTIKGVQGADPTLLEWDGLWYLFVAGGDADYGRSEELNIFLAETPFGPFRPHPENPVVRDVRCARMAGRFFFDGGRLYRPAQVAAPFYGKGIRIMRVEEISPIRYREVLHAEITARWRPGLLGMHTLNAAHGLSAVDLLRRSKIARTRSGPAPGPP